jgi:glycosyltransferase involved in cell wall biosynthesis
MPREPRLRLRVLWVVDHTDAPLGSFRGMLDVLRRIDRTEFDVLAVVPGHGPCADALAALGATVHSRALPPSGWTLAYLRAVWSLRRLLLRERVDLLYAPDHTRWRAAELLAARAAGVPAVVHLHAPPTDDMSWDPLLRGVRAVIGNSGATLAPLRDALAADRLHVIAPCIDLDAFTAPGDLRGTFFPARTLVVGFVGMLRPQKGFDEFLDMVRLLRTTQPDLRYLVVGGDARPRKGNGVAHAREQAAARGVADVVHFTGLRADVPQLMRSIDVLVVPSRQEGFGQVIVEANASGVPVVAFAVGGIVEVIEDGITGRLVPQGDAGALADTVRGVLADCDWRARVAEIAPARVRARFAPAAQVRAIEAVWRGAAS